MILEPEKVKPVTTKSEICVYKYPHGYWSKTHITSHIQFKIEKIIIVLDYG